MRRKMTCEVRGAVTGVVRVTYLEPNPEAPESAIGPVSVQLDFGDSGYTLTLGVLEAQVLGAFLGRL